MWLRMTISPEREIMACEAAMDATPYVICPGAAPGFASLAGLKIEAGFIRAAMERVGGAQGCTHLRELLQQMGTVAMQTLYSVGKLSDDSCFAWSESREMIAVRHPAFYTGG
jgi:hypothetical protein